MIALLIIAGFVVLGLAIGLAITASAPMGYQDQSGFHYGQPDGQCDEEFPVGLAQPKPA